MAQSSFSLAGQFVRFSSLGVVGTASHYVILIIGVELGVRPIISSILGFLVGALVNYSLSYYYVFCSGGSHSHTMARFFIVALCGVGINTLVLSYAINTLRLHYLLGQMMATGIVVVWNFVGNRWWTFREAAYGKFK